MGHMISLKAFFCLVEEVRATSPAQHRSQWGLETQHDDPIGAPLHLSQKIVGCGESGEPL